VGAAAVGALAGSAAAPAAPGIIAISDDKVAQYREALEAAKEVARDAAFVDENAPDATEQLRQAELILAIGPRALQLARSAAPQTPTVYCMVLASSVQPSKNVTGVALEVPPYVQFAEWKQIKWDGLRVGVVYDPQASKSYFDEAGKAAAALGLTLVTRPITQSKDLLSAVAQIADKIDVLWLMPDPQLFTAEAGRSLIGFALERKVPVLAFADTFTQAGALASMTPDPRDIGRRAARLAIGILGRNPDARMPLPPPTTSPGALSVNLRTAAQLDIDVPDSLLRKAHQIYR
jgi:ABC-type uncharacterized transport system substrate-binding protein